MIIPMLCVTIFVILVVWFLLPRVARLMIHTPTAISIFVCLSMVQLMAVFISMRCTLCGQDRKSGSAGMPRPRSTLFPYTTLFRSRKANDSHADCYQYFCVPEYGTANGRLHFHAVHFMRTRSEERFSRNAETEIYTLSLHDALPISQG